MKKPILVIAGPTACGKTDAAIQVAKKINAEIISVDSMQVYKYMDIGTAKPTLSEQQGIKHYMIDELYPDEEFSVAVFQRMANGYLENIYKAGKIPVLVGGTGFYLNAVLYNNNFSDMDVDWTYRNELATLAQERGNEYLHNLLREVDSESADNIHCNNVKKVIRALEYFKQTGTKISLHNQKEKKRESPYDIHLYILNRNREQLYERINMRVDKMLQDGLVEEVKGLLERGYSPSLTSMQGLGYKEIVSYLTGEIDLDCAVEILKRDTRHFAKRQLTWFRHQTDGIWIDMEKQSAIDEILGGMTYVDSIVTTK